MAGSLFDTSVWVALAFGNHPFHAAAKVAFAAADSRVPIIVCRATQHSFLRQISSPTLQAAYRANPISNRAAWSKWEELAGLPQVAFAPEPADLSASWRRFADRATPSPKVWMDAYLAAFAVSATFDLVTLDRDFQAYEPHGLRLRLLARASAA